MPSPRSPKDDVPRAPDSLTVAGGGSAVDRLYDISQRVSSIERFLTYLEGHADDAKKRLDSISTEITEAKATFGHSKILIPCDFRRYMGIALSNSSGLGKTSFRMLTGVIRPLCVKYILPKIIHNHLKTNQIKELQFGR